MSFSPFDESPLAIRRSTTSGSMNTSAVDAFRQGVELTQDKFYQLGPVKIHSGEPQHMLRQNNVGEPTESLFPNQTNFLEIDVFDLLTFMQRDVSQTFLSTFIAFRASATVDWSIMDGIIEPLSVRPMVTFTSIYSPIEPHQVRGNVEGGNYSIIIHSDKIAPIQRFDEIRVGSDPLIDTVDAINGVPVNIPFFPAYNRTIKPFNDAQVKSGIILSSSFDSDIRRYVQEMSPETESYVPDGYFASTTGWDD